MKAILAHRVTVAAVLAFLPILSLAHGGGLDRNGCHTNRKTGDYHCHGGGSSTPPSRAAAPPAPRPAAYVMPPTALHEPDDRALVRTAQTLLRALGYRPSLLGTVDERTRAAIEAFQSAQSMKADGVVSANLVLRLAQAVSEKTCQ